MSGTYSRDLCYYEAAINTGNSRICENVIGVSGYSSGKYGGPYSTSKEECEFLVAIETRDLTVCEFEGDFCYIQIAKDTNDPAFCEPIGDYDLRNVCLSYFDE